MLPAHTFDLRLLGEQDCVRPHIFVLSSNSQPIPIVDGTGVCNILATMGDGITLGTSVGVQVGIDVGKSVGVALENASVRLGSSVGVMVGRDVGKWV
jgi:hypothetical protein